MTAKGTLLGTLQYMAPEQLEGGPIDTRTDLFAFGAVLHEMLTGARAFRAASQAGLISAILKEPPTSLAQLRPELPRDLDRIIRRCLAKDHERRFQTAVDLRNEFEDLQEQLISRRVTRATALGLGAKTGAWVVAITLGVAIIIIAGFLLGWPPVGRPTSTPPLRATFDRLTSPPGSELSASLSPDGGWVVYAADGSGGRDIFLQSVGGQNPINLTPDSPNDDEHPTFSPDGERIAFRSSRGGGGIFVMGRTGEAVRRVTRTGFNPSWSRDGTELAYTTVATELRPQNADQRGQLMVVSLSGGAPRLLYNGAMLPT